MFEPKGADIANPDLAVGDWVMRCEARTLDDIRALGGNDAADERRFETAARVSEANLALYRTFAQPIVRALVNAPLAQWMHGLHPLRLQYELLSDANPLTLAVSAVAAEVRKDRRPAATDNPFLAMQEAASGQIVAALDLWRQANEAVAERTFLTVYGLPWLQATMGIDPAGTHPLRKAARSPIHDELLHKRIAELKSRITAGGLREGVVRALLYVGMGRAGVDERGFEAVRRIRRTQGELSLASFKALVREQFSMLLIDREAALAALPSLLPADSESRRKAFDLIQEVIGARGRMSAEDQSRMQEIAKLFGVEDSAPSSFRQAQDERQARAS